MNRSIPTLAAAALAAALAVPAAAQQQQPGRTADTMQQGQMQPKQSVDAMDNNAQRAHSRTQTQGASQGTSRGTSQGGAPQTASADVRDWNAIDKNDDNLIQPEEMEEALKATAKK